MKNFILFLLLSFGPVAHGQRFVKTFNSLDDAYRANLNDVHTNLFISYRSYTNDGGGGQFWYDKTATTTTNLGTIFGNTGGGRLFRVWDKDVDPRWFGANDSCDVAATVQVQAAIDFASRPTYGWQKFSGQATSSTNNASFSVNMDGCYLFDAPIYVRGGVDLRIPKSGSLAGDYGAHGNIQSKHSGHTFIVDFNGDPLGSFRQPTIRNLFITGYAETYKSGKKDITGVISRTQFQVADADAPPTIEDPTLAASNNSCLFYDNEGSYLGSGRVINTSSAAGTTTVTLQTGSDVYTSVNGAAGNLLTATCKVAWWNRVTEESISGITDFSDPSGICAIYIKNLSSSQGTVPRIEDVYITRFDTGIRIGPRIVGGGQAIKDVRMVRCRFAGFSFPRPYNTPDIEFGGTVYTTGYYGADYGATRTNTFDIAGLHYCTYGLYGVPAASKWDVVLAEQAAYANVYFLRPIFPSFNQLFADNIIRYGLAFGPSYRAFSAPTTSAENNWVTVGNLKVRTQLAGLSSDTLHPGDAGGVKFELTDTAKFNGLAIGSFEAFTASAQTNKLPWAFDLQSASYNNRVKISRVVEQNGITNWVAASSKLPEVAPHQLSSAADIGNGFYGSPTVNQVDLAVGSARVASFTSSKSKFSNSTGVDILALSNDGNSREVTFSLGTDSLAIDNKTNSTRFGQWSSSATDTTLFLGYSQNPTASTLRAAFLKAEGSSGSDQGSGDFYIYGAPGTGSGTSGGTLNFSTANPGSSGSSAQTPSVKLQIGRYGGLRFIGQAAEPTVGVSGNVYFNSTTRSLNFFDGSYHQPLSLQGDETTVASASTVNLGFQSTDKVYLTGTTTINSFGAALGGTRRIVRFEGVLTLTYNASSMILPSGASITTAAGDTLEAVCISTGNWRVIWYQRASGASLVSSGGVTTSDSPTWTGAHVFSKNGALSLPTVSITGIPITGGSATTTKPLVLIETAGATSTAWQTSGTMFGINAPSGFAGRLFEYQINGASYFYGTSGGTLFAAGSLSVGGSVISAAAQNVSWSGRSEMLSPSDGVILLQNAANTDFTRLEFGGSTTSFPALGRSGTTIAVQLGGGTAGGKLSVGTTQSKVGGTIDQKYSSTGTPASSTETDLHTFTTAASSLGADGDGFTMTSGGTFAGNASATSQLRVYFGGTQIFASGALTAAAAGSWQIETMIIRDSSTTIRAITTLTATSAVTVPLVSQTDVTGLTLSNSNILKVTGQGGGASPAANDIVYKLGRIRFEPAY